MSNILMRLIEKIGEKTVTGAEVTLKRAREVSTALQEQDDAATSLMERRVREKEDRKKLIEDKLMKLKEEVSYEGLPEEDELNLIPEREELKIPFSVRVATIISDFFSKYSYMPGSFFKNIQEDLYRANIIMPASKYVSLAIGISVIVAIISGILVSVVGGLMLGSIGALLGFVIGPVFGMFTFMYSKIYPRKKVKARSDDFSRELPFALRHMATMLSSGSGLLETMRSISSSEYGVLSEEFNRAMMEIEKGATIEEAYDRINLRVSSASFKKATRQIISTLKTGGNLANTLKVIAEETATEMRMKLKDFIQVLNTLSLMYMFLTVIAPVLITILVIAMSFAIRGVLIPPMMMWVVYLVFFGAAVYMSVMIKKFEPKV